MRSALAVYVKYPEPGKVKTRLAASLGPERAAAVYVELIRIVTLAARDFSPVYVCDPFRPLSDYETYFPGARLALQEGETLGDRLNDTFEGLLKLAPSAIIVGSDCPELSKEHLLEADRALSTHDLVLGPATDGGYYLVGLTRPERRLFVDMAWSTSTVLETTLRRAAELSLRVHLLPTLSDIDTEEDCRFLSPETFRDVLDLG